MIASAREMLGSGELEKALMMAEALVAANSNSNAALQLELDVLAALLKRAQATHQTFSEIAWLQTQMKKVKAQLAQ